VEDVVRKLASVQKIVDIQPIPGYDKVEMATTLGWKCIVKKYTFNVGDLCVYIEPDSQLYPHEIWDEFLAKRKWRIRTMRMCKVISQGLIIPIDSVEKLKPKAKYKLKEGFDLTDILDVTHFEKGKMSEEGSKKYSKKRGPVLKFLLKFHIFRKIWVMFNGSDLQFDFPKHLVKETNETNIQAMPNFITRNRDKEMYSTEKLEGQNGNYILSKNGRKTIYSVCSHHRTLPNKNNSSWWTISDKYSMEKILRDYHRVTGDFLAIQGEIVGDGIQKNIYKIDGYDFYVFSIKVIETGHYFTLDQKMEFCKIYGLKLVPVVNASFVFTQSTDVDDIMEMSNGTSVLYNTAREGIVIRRVDDDTISIKARSPKYLIKQ